MCHQNGVLIQRALEEARISTISISIFAWVTKMVRPPRAVAVNSQRGSTLGSPHQKQLHYQIVEDMLTALEKITEPGTIVDLPYIFEF